MPSFPEYHLPVRYSVPILLCLGLALAPLSAVSQTTTAPAVHPYTGAVRPPTGAVPLAPSHAPYHPPAHANPPHSGTTHHRAHPDDYAPGFVYAVPVPYAVDPDVADQDDPNSGYDSNDQGGPTVFDRRGSGARSYVPPVEDLSASRAADPDPETAQQPTLLVFKDGHTLQVGNYAIVGATLFDLTPGHARKVALADLDLDATQKQNDARGNVFQLPPSAQAN